MARGTRYESIMTFLVLTGPADMRWLTAREAEDWGFTRKPVQDTRTPRSVSAVLGRPFLPNTYPAI